MVELGARDEAGNTSGASFDFALIAPTPGPQDDSSDDPGVGPTLIGSPTPTDSSTPTRTPRATPTASTVNFGGPPAAPANDSTDDSIANLQSPISDRPSGSSSAVVLPPSGMVFGAAALALAGVATAIALDNARRRKEEEARIRAEMERKNAEAEAREAAQQAALAQARSEAEFNLILGQIWDQATGGQGPSKAWLASKEAMLEPKIAPPSPPLDLAKLKQQHYAAGEASEGAQKAAAAAAAYATYRASERALAPVETPWWQAPWLAIVGLGSAVVEAVAGGRSGPSRVEPTPAPARPPTPATSVPLATETPSPIASGIRPVVTSTPENLPNAAGYSTGIPEPGPWWKRALGWVTGIEDLVLRPPPLLSISYDAKAPGFSLASYALDEWVTYQPLARNWIETITYQSVSVRGDLSYKWTTNPSGLIDLNFGSGRITFSGTPRSDGSRSSWYIQPGSMSFGSISSFPVELDQLPASEGWDAGKLVSVTAVDFDLFGPNWASLKVSHGEGSTLSSVHEVDGGEVQRSLTSLAQIEMGAYRSPRVLVGIGVAAGLALVGWEAAAALGALAPALQQLRLVLGV